MRKGPLSSIISFFWICCLIAFGIACLRFFNGNVTEMITWILASIWNLIMSIADAIGNSGVFG